MGDEINDNGFSAAVVEREHCAVVAWNHFMDACKLRGLAPHHVQHWCAATAIRNSGIPAIPAAMWDEWAMAMAQQLYAQIGPMSAQSLARIQVALLDAMRLGHALRQPPPPQTPKDGPYKVSPEQEAFMRDFFGWKKP